MSENLAEKRWSTQSPNKPRGVAADFPECPSDARSLSIADYQNLLDLIPSRIASFAFQDQISATLPPQKMVDKLWSTRSFCIEANQGFVRDHGFTDVEQVLGLPYARFFPPNEKNFNLVKNWAENDLTLRNFEVIESSKDGQESIWLVNFFAVIDQGIIQRVWTTARDVTERRNAIRKLEAAEKHYRTLVERPDLVLVRATPDNHYLYVSPHAGEIHGHTVEQLKSIPGLFQSLLHPDDLATHQKVIKARESRSKESIDIEYRAKHIDGTYHWYYERQIPKLNERGEVEFYDCLQIDIQDRKQLEIDLEQARKMEIFGTLAGGIAHDFNNHLAAILGQISLSLSELDRSHPSYSRLAAAEQAALASAEIAKTLLTLGRKSATSPLTPLDLPHLVEETVDLLRHLLPSTIEVQIEIDPNAPLWILGNTVQLQQVLMNLGTNSRDAMTEIGLLKFTLQPLIVKEKPVAGYPGLAVGEYVELAVTDTGKGMSPEQLSHMFEPYYTTKESGKGTGMGLSMVYSIVHNHHGAIQVESQLGKGTTFRIALPATDSLRPKSQLNIFDRDLPRGTETVLVADDDELVRSMVTTALTRQGYTVIEAVDGQQAIDLFQQHCGQIKLALVDLTMPKITGREILDRISEIQSEIPVILTSGYHQDGAAGLPVSGRYTEFLAKPYPLPKLLQMVRGVIDRMLIADRPETK